jgi:hypothetical protein
MSWLDTPLYSESAVVCPTKMNETAGMSDGHSNEGYSATDPCILCNGPTQHGPRNKGAVKELWYVCIAILNLATGGP